MIKHLSTDLKIFKFNDGEDWWIVAKDLPAARKFFENECADKETLWDNAWEEYQSISLAHGYDVKELTKDNGTMIRVTENDDLISTINRYRNQNEKVELLNIWDLVMWDLVETKLHDVEQIMPYLIASSVF